MICYTRTGEHSKGYIKSRLPSADVACFGLLGTIWREYNSSPAVFSLISSSISAFCTRIIAIWTLGFQFPDYQISRLPDVFPPGPSQDLKDLARLIPRDARVAQPPPAVASHCLCVSLCPLW
jgi:hypothetical protein